MLPVWHNQLATLISDKKGVLRTKYVILLVYVCDHGFFFYKKKFFNSYLAGGMLCFFCKSTRTRSPMCLYISTKVPAAASRTGAVGSWYNATMWCKNRLTIRLWAPYLKIERKKNSEGSTSGWPQNSNDGSKWHFASAQIRESLMRNQRD